MVQQVDYGKDTVAAFPADIRRPAILGIPKVGQTLTAQPAVYVKGTTSVAYQWFRDGVAISGATANTYTLVSADEGRSITVQSIGTNAQGSDPSPSVSDPVSVFTSVVVPNATLSSVSWDMSVPEGTELATINANLNGATVDSVSPNDGRFTTNANRTKILRGSKSVSKSDNVDVTIVTSHPKGSPLPKTTVVTVNLIGPDVTPVLPITVTDGTIDNFAASDAIVIDLPDLVVLESRQYIPATGPAFAIDSAGNLVRGNTPFRAGNATGAIHRTRGSDNIPDVNVTVTMTNVIRLDTTKVKIDSTVGLAGDDAAPLLRATMQRWDAALAVLSKQRGI